MAERVGLSLRKRNPDVLTCIANLSNDEVFTPPELANQMLDLVADAWATDHDGASIWADPSVRFLDPFTKSGVFLREITKRLVDGLAGEIPDLQERVDHILTRQVFGIATTQLTSLMARRSVYCSKYANGQYSIARSFTTEDGRIWFEPMQHTWIGGTVTVTADEAGEPVEVRTGGRCTYCGASQGALDRGGDLESHAYAFLHTDNISARVAELFGANMQFDVIIGNPPYQIGTEGFGSTASSVYQLFVEHAIDLEPKYLAMITPSRWFTGGKGLDDFRAAMIADRHLAKMVDNPKIFDCFPGVKIRGGVNYFLWDRDHDGDCEFSTRIDGRIISTEIRDLREGDGVLVRDNRAMSVVEKVSHSSPRRAEELCTVTKPFGLTMRSNYPGSVTEPFDGAIPLIYGSHMGYSRPDQIQRNHGWIDRWKVLLPRASSGDTAQDETGQIVDVVLGEPIALAPGSACTQTYFIAGMFDTREETENYANYLATKFVRFLVLQRKATQDVTPDRFRFVPLLDMTRPWTDEDLYEHFGLSPDEIAYIEATIKPRSVNLSLDSPIPASHLPGGSKYRPPSEWALAEAEPDGDEG